MPSPAKIRKQIVKCLELIPQEEHSNLRVLQIGANDGFQNDPIALIIKKFSLHADLIEPMPVYFSELKETYKESTNVRCHNIAIAEIDGFKEMTYIKYNDTLPIWMKGLSTFAPEKNFLGTGHSGMNMTEDETSSYEWEYVRDNLETVNIQTTKLENFLEKNDIDRVDIYVSDTEGYDGIIFDQFDLNNFKPIIIIMETHTLDDVQNSKIEEKLEKFNYKIISKDTDTFAVREEIYDKLRSVL